MKDYKVPLLVLSVMLVGLAAAATFAELTIDPNTQAIDVSGSPNPVVTYTVTLQTDDPSGSAGTLFVSTDSPAVWAEIGDSTPDQQSSFYPFTVSGTPDGDGIITMTFTLYATVDDANEASILDQNRKIRVRYEDKEGEVLAMVTGRIYPVPEMGTILLTSAGLLGLIGVVRFKRD